MKKLGCFCNICGCDVEECAGWGLKPSKNPCRFTFHLPAEASRHVCEDCILALGKVAEVMTRGISPVSPPRQGRFAVGQVVRCRKTGILVKVLEVTGTPDRVCHRYRLSGSEQWYNEDELDETINE